MPEKYVPKTDEERKKEKQRRMMEKMMRLPVNDVVLEVQKGVIDLKDFFKEIDARLVERMKEKK